eukprot:9088082-Lingulodinium_polyedra.AAC.1
MQDKGAHQHCGVPGASALQPAPAEEKEPEATTQEPEREEKSDPDVEIDDPEYDSGEDPSEKEAQAEEVEPPPP